MTKRPRAVTVIGWFWRVGGILGLISALPFAFLGMEWFGDLASGPFWQLPPSLLFLYGLFVSLVFLVCGNGLLKGRNWSRVLGLATCIVTILIGLVWYEKTLLFWFNLIWDAGLTGIMWFFLYRPHATAFFRGEAPLVEG
jgi:hypothetical protein